MATGKKAASTAGKELVSKSSTKAEKRVAASDLAQAPKGRAGKASSAESALKGDFRSL